MSRIGIMGEPFPPSITDTCGWQSRPIQNTSWILCGLCRQASHHIKKIIK